MKGNKNVRIVKGDSLLTDINMSKKWKKGKKVYQTKVEKCLTCTKPVSECKGDCE